MTLLVQNTGNEAWYSDDGQLIGGSAGLFRYESLYDHAGTPTDSSDDEFLDFLGSVKQTGRNSDFCDAMVQAIG